MELFSYKYVGLGYIYDEYILRNLLGFGYFELKEILFGISSERELELFSVGEISYLKHLLLYGFVGVGVFYISIFYYILRVLRLRNVMALTPNIFIWSRKVFIPDILSPIFIEPADEPVKSISL